MKKFIKLSVLFLFILGSKMALACDACQKQQPKVLRNIAHGAGPEGNMDYVIVGVIAAITLLTLFYAVKYLIFPGERQVGHIKNLDLN